MLCLDCRYATVITDSKGKRHSICTNVESPKFMELVDYVFESCDEGEQEEDDDE